VLIGVSDIISDAIFSHYLFLDVLDAL
jgi:hypothetical protein